MSFLRTAFWVVVAVFLAVFTVTNWDAPQPNTPGRIAIALWGTNVLEVRLPILIICAFLLGLVPTWLWGRARKWQLQRKLNSAERALASAVATQQTEAALARPQSLPVDPDPA
ncbi:MAG: LapA family protein [Sphingobium sp.]